MVAPSGPAPVPQTGFAALTPQPLFGGAMTAALPRAMTSVALLRQIPDNQEVFASQGAEDTSVIIELTEPAATAPGQLPAVWHFHELAELNDARGADAMLMHQLAAFPSDVIGIQDAAAAASRVAAALPFPASAYSFAVGTQRIAKFNEQAKNVVAVLVAVIRLADVETDVVVTYHVPTVLDPASSSAAAVAAAATSGEAAALSSPSPALALAPDLQAAWSTFLALVASVRVLDYGLFGA
ncbi:hypothetical protein CXG81DRAFT_24339 [Caulochytrium protostelioides]|uniref:Mog1p/PsbP-like protein n=1 Tax=Caulochytrium protostelioides TaxID=1555241 RepID=A0A4P9XC72_9FUNG|nr:hypothetical protein CXG81DRAFT_24339 [Caulochytrium protostelioides]|eukprot:RKP03028.1 hypothetical protein CXG81DRAFT_24339 [Caulochytrium protostelioides]